MIIMKKYFEFIHINLVKLKVENLDTTLSYFQLSPITRYYMKVLNSHKFN